MLQDAQSQSSSSAATTTTDSTPLPPNELESRLSTIRETLLSLPEELCSAASSSTRTSKTRIELLGEELRKRIEYARHSPTSPKWTHVARLVRLGCTSRGYVSVAPGVRPGDLRPVEKGDYEFVIPETEEEWNECERRWQERFTTPVREEKERASKYWAQGDGKPEEVRAVTKGVQEKVANWREEVQREGANPPMSQSAAITEKAKEPAKETASVPTKPQKQMQLGFNCAKRSTTQGMKSRGPPPPPPPQLQITLTVVDQPRSAGPTTGGWPSKTSSHQTISWPPAGQAEAIAMGLIPAFSATESKDKDAVSSAIESPKVPVPELFSPETLRFMGLPIIGEPEAVTEGKEQRPSSLVSPVEQEQPPAAEAEAEKRTVPSEPSVGLIPAPATDGDSAQSGCSHRSSLPAGQAEAIAKALITVSSGATRITEVSEMSFLPPSFPSELRTSTPQPAEKSNIPSKRKPSPIPHEPHFTQSPMSVQSLPLPPVDHVYETPHSSSSLPPESPTRIGTKRPRYSTPPQKADDAIPSLGLSYATPPPKKARGEPQAEPNHEPSPPQISEMEMDRPRIPPPPVVEEFLVDTHNPSTPLRAASTSTGLGNAMGLPVPTTPNNQLPTLAELLATSRRSKPRPRPPSRKTPAAKRTAGSSKFTPALLPGEDVLPTVADPIEETSACEDERGETSARSMRSRSYFSSPASGSSDSPMSIRSRPRSPVSPLFTQESDAFAPALASTQRLDMRRGGLLREAHAGIFGMTYSSQYDVEAGIGRVSELLDRDVDFEGWLRDVPEEEEEAPKGLSQSQGEVAV